MYFFFIGMNVFVVFFVFLLLLVELILKVVESVLLIGI